MDGIDSAKKYIVTEQWAELPLKVFPYATVVDEYIVQSECNCSKEMFFGILMSVETDELKNQLKLEKMKNWNVVYVVRGIYLEQMI